jgi:CelD/BcsL family acetyltransferase involved in cellulose biosynthesis
MFSVLEINDAAGLAPSRQDWAELLGRTPGAAFFQSLEWLEIYWRHFGQGQQLRTLVVMEEDSPVGILPLVVHSERSKVGPIRVLTFPLNDWGSFYGPIGPAPRLTLTLGMEHIQRTRRDWDILELRWQGALGTDPALAQAAMHAAGFQAYATEWDRTAIVDLDGTWESYWSSRKGAWLRRFRHAEHKLAEQGELRYVHFRPKGQSQGDGSPRWDLYDACENLAQRSWQGSAENGTTLSHESVRRFLRDAHEVASTAGAVDLNLLYLGDSPVAFVYGYHCRGYVYGLRRGFDSDVSREGAGNVLLGYTLRDCLELGDRVYDMGVGSIESKRNFLTRMIPILRFSHYPPLALRTQVLRLKRWWQGRSLRSD